MRLWNYSSKDEPYANIPEFPKANDRWNISTLMGFDKMHPFWVNLYGIHPDDRGKGINILHSSSFMGRILMNLHLQPHSKPQYMIRSCSPATEPKIISYQLWVDVYDLFNCDEILDRASISV